MKPIPNPADVHEMMIENAQKAVEFAKATMDVTLDYTPESLEKVEDILDTLSAQVPKSFIMRLIGKGPSHEDLIEMSILWGGYIGEVCRKQWHGDWTVNTELLKNEWLYALTIGENQMFPPAKVFKRLKNGKDDNIMFYYQAFVKVMDEDEEMGKEEAEKNQ